MARQGNRVPGMCGDYVGRHFSFKDENWTIEGCWLEGIKADGGKENSHH